MALASAVAASGSRAVRQQELRMKVGFCFYYVCMSQSVSSLLRLLLSLWMCFGVELLCFASLFHCCFVRCACCACWCVCCFVVIDAQARSNVILTQTSNLCPPLFNPRSLKFSTSARTNSKFVGGFSSVILRRRFDLTRTSTFISIDHEWLRGRISIISCTGRY